MEVKTGKTLFFVWHIVFIFIFYIYLKSLKIEMRIQSWELEDVLSFLSLKKKKKREKETRRSY